MKFRDKPQNSEAANQQLGSESAQSEHPIAQTHRWWFRGIALLSPVVLFCVLEVVLRIAGYGYPTGFFLQASDSPETIVENPRFGWRFFPPQIARVPEPIRFSAQKPPSTVRIFVFGESAALGDPEPAYGFARQLERMLQTAHPDKQFEVINVAMTAINSHVFREIARDCRDKQGDLWLFYAGNNEVIGPYGAGTVFGKQAPTLSAVRLALALKKTRIGQFFSRLGARKDTPAEWQGMELFLKQQVSHDDPRLKQVYRNYSANLADVIAFGRKSGAKVIVGSMAVNLKDCPPFASAHRPGLSESELQKWNSTYADAQEAERRGEKNVAANAYDVAAGIDDQFAELSYRRGVLDLARASADKSTARADLASARELDTLRFRADGALNNINRQAPKNGQADFLDIEQLLPAKANVEIPGDDLFFDHVHLNFHGNYLLASLFLPQVERALFGSEKTGARVLSEEEVLRQLALTDLDRQRVYQEMRLRLQQAPFSTQSNFRQRDQQWSGRLEQIKPDVAECLQIYREAIALHTNDWVLHQRFARALLDAGDSAGAELEWQQVANLVPQEPEAWFQLADLAYNKKQYADARKFYEVSLQRKSNSPEALNGLGLVSSALGDKSAAQTHFQQALMLNPRFSAARVNLASLLASNGELPAAMAEYQNVLRTDTNNVAARINLAQLLIREGKTDAGIELYRQAIAINPTEALAHYNLGNALSARQQYTEAISHYSEAVKANPRFTEARYNLALELARTGRIQEAIAQFSELLQLRPDMVDAHFNYGIALAKEKRYPEAIEQFKQTLLLAPQHTAAESALKKAQALLNQPGTGSLR